MSTTTGVWAEAGFILFTLFVVAPAIAAAIGYAAWKGQPKSLDSEMYWTVFVSTGAVATIIIVCALHLHTGGSASLHLVSLAGLVLGALIFGVSLGFGVGIFTRRLSRLNQNRTQ
jgi:hypothetical protein